MSSGESSAADLRVAFIAASTWHGTLDRADALLAAYPELAGSDIHTAAILGDDRSVRAHLARDPACVHATSEPYGANALTHLCLSKYLRLRSDACGWFPASRDGLARCRRRSESRVLPSDRCCRSSPP